MAGIAVEPLYMSECTFTVASDEYSAALSGVTFTPSASTSNWQGLAAGSVFTKTSKATWTCVLAFVQDWGTADSLANYLFANEGESITATFVPDDGGPTITATLQVTPGSIGGTVNSFATSSVTLACQGKPTITPAA